MFYWHPGRHSICHSIWHIFWHISLPFSLAFCLTHFFEILCGISFDMLSDIYWHPIRHFYLAVYLTYLLTFFHTFIRLSVWHSIRHMVICLDVSFGMSIDISSDMRFILTYVCFGISLDISSGKPLDLLLLTCFDIGSGSACHDICFRKYSDIFWQISIDINAGVHPTDIYSAIWPVTKINVVFPPAGKGG